MTQTITVPLSKLKASAIVNARGGAKTDVKGLAHSIQSKGLIQPLAVRPMDGGDSFEVTDGGRRLRAMQQLVKDKVWKRDTPVPVLIRNEDDTDAFETSLVANTERTNMHPVEEFEAYAELEQRGRTPEQIAASFGITLRTVKQRLALGRLAPDVRKAWAKGRIKTEVAQAFTISASHEVQSDALKVLLAERGKYSEQLGVHDVRRALAKGDLLLTTDHKVKAVGLDAYMAAGGTVTQSLFDETGWIDDPLLLASLARKKIDDTCNRLIAEGWSWALPRSKMPDGWNPYSSKFRGHPEFEYTEQQEQQIHNLEGQLLKLLKTKDADAIAESRQRIADWHKAILDQHYTPEVRARTGCVVEVGYDGDLDIYYGMLGAAAVDAAASASGEVVDNEYDNGDDEFGGAVADAPSGRLDDGDQEGFGQTGLSGALVQTLTEAQTIAAAATLQEDAGLALRVIVATLASETLYDGAPAKITAAGFNRSNRNGSFADQFEDLSTANAKLLQGLLAKYVAASLDLRMFNASSKPNDSTAALINALDGKAYLANMRSAFDASDFFKRATRAVAESALEEMTGEGAADTNDLPGPGASKAAIAELAATAAKRCGWLPDRLRSASYELILSRKGARR